MHKPKHMLCKCNKLIIIFVLLYSVVCVYESGFQPHYSSILHVRRSCKTCTYSDREMHVVINHKNWTPRSGRPYRGEWDIAPSLFIQ